MAKFNIEKVRFLLENYQKDLPEFWSEEKYKWEAVEFFQENWDIESPDFWKMMKFSTSKHVNLLGSGMYFPLGMLQDFIKVNQERVRNMFRILYDEGKDLIERISFYQKEAEQLRLTNTNRWKNHYQDLRAVSVLLWLRYPDKYYIYKSREFRKTLDSIESDFSHKGSTTPEYYVRFLDMMNDIREEINKDDGVKNTLHELLQSTQVAYEDANLHVATIDFVFYVGKRYENEQNLINDKLQLKMGEQRKLQIGDMSDNGQITIVDEDRLCYIVKSESRGASGLRTISKALLDEYIQYVEKHPDTAGNDARDNLSGLTGIDKYEYGYNSTLVMMAKMVLGYVGMIEGRTAKRTITKRICSNLQQIYYGAPGTGKSHEINRLTKGKEVVRTTFHPDSDYSTFVGAYKPTTIEIPMRDIAGHIIFDEENGKQVTENRIVYEFVEQAFLQAYIKAWNVYVDASEGEDAKEIYLIIEEINRGNCAQIFGDLFQLLDRNGMGFSDYPIQADKDMKKQLAKAFKGKSIADAERINKIYEKDIVSQVLNGEILLLPDNFYIWATMNTSDQSLFPIDSAFKRRWDWQYTPICEGKSNDAQPLGWKIKANGNEYDWWSFLQKINYEIGELTKSEDKKLGYFFCKPVDGIISAETFVGKVVFYLWNDVFKDQDLGSIFHDKEGNEITFNSFYGVDKYGKAFVQAEVIEMFLNNLELRPVEEATTDEINE